MTTDSTVLLTQNAFAPEQALHLFRTQHKSAGGIVSFTGSVREQTKDGRSVQALFLQHYPDFTQSEIERITQKAHSRWDLHGTHIIHRTGEIVPGEPIVFVATAASHRRDAFEAADFLMDLLKTDAPFWKKERYDDGEAWIEPRREDRTDRQRWE